MLVYENGQYIEKEIEDIIEEVIPEISQTPEEKIDEIKTTVNELKQMFLALLSKID